MILQDSGSVFWLIGVTDSGQPTSTVVGSGPVTPTILVDPGDSSLWQIGITTLGNLTSTSVASGASTPSVRLVSAPSGLLWNLSLVPFGSGTLQTVFVPIISDISDVWVSGSGY